MSGGHLANTDFCDGPGGMGLLAFSQRREIPVVGYGHVYSLLLGATGGGITGWS